MFLLSKFHEPIQKMATLPGVGVKAPVERAGWSIAAAGYAAG
jgi:hypothetical protein